MNRREFIKASGLATSLLLPQHSTWAASGASFIGPFFSYPYDSNGRVQTGRMDASVHERVLDLFRGITSKTKIRGAAYIWRYHDFGGEQANMSGPFVSSPKIFLDTIATELRRSGAKDAAFIVDREKIDEGARNKFFQLSAELGIPGLLFAKPSAGTDRIMHSKFFTFSSLEYSKPPAGYPTTMDDVVAVLSANIDNEMYKAANNLVIMHGNKELYETMFSLWQYTRNMPQGLAIQAVSKSCGNVHVYSFPRYGDVVIDVLLRVLQQHVRNPSPTNPPRIRVGMFLLSRDNVKTALAVLAILGADVRVVLSNSADNIALDQNFGSSGVKSRILPNNHGKMHSKYLLIDANYDLSGVVRRRKLVWTGSHNYTYDALNENDEVMVRIDNQGVYSSYLQDFNKLWTMAAAVSQT